MTLLDAKPPRPVTGIRKHVPLHILIPIVVLVAILCGLVGFRFWNFRQEQAVTRFLVTLEQGDYQKAYQLWQPAQSYTYDNFIHDWGEKGDYGKIREFEILASSSKGAIVIVTVRINNVNPPLDLVVDRNTQGLAFSSF
jgi:hypothetical protein